MQPGYNSSAWPKALKHINASRDLISGAVLYTSVSHLSSLPPTPVPLAIHASGKSTAPLERSDQRIIYDYPSTASEIFARPFDKHFDYANEAVSHSRSLAFLKKRMNGPWFDLEAIWDEHTYFEFGERNVEKTMATMVQEPYVNHVPTVCSTHHRLSGVLLTNEE